MSIAEFPYRLAAIGGPFRDAIGKLRSHYTKKQVPEGAKFVCSARVDHAVLGLPGAEVKIDAVVDINPFRQGKWLAGVGQQVVAPETLRDLAPDVVVAMNPIYGEEIRRDLDRLNVSAKLLAV